MHASLIPKQLWLAISDPRYQAGTGGGEVLILIFLQPCPHAFPLPLLYKLKANYVKKEKQEGEHGDKAYHYWWVGGGGESCIEFEIICIFCA